MLVFLVDIFGNNFSLLRLFYSVNSASDLGLVWLDPLK